MVSGLWRGLHILFYCGLGDTALRQAEEEIVSGFSVSQGQDFTVHELVSMFGSRLQ